MHCPDVSRATRLNDGRHVDQINRTYWRPLPERAEAEPPCLRYDQPEFEHTGALALKQNGKPSQWLIHSTYRRGCSHSGASQEAA
jgi:hypothetical protein